MTTLITALRMALTDEMEADPRVFIMGEDVGIGGSFHLSLGLLERFGPTRIRDTPNSESGFVGLGIGAALGGLRPVIDFQYGDFLLCAADQVVQQAAKFHFMSGGQVNVPLVLHAPTGASGRGAQHANSVENFFFGVPGLIIGVPSTPYDAKGMMTAAIRHSAPVLLCSHKHLYGTAGRTVIQLDTGNEVPLEPYEIPIGHAVTRRTGSDVTIVGVLLTAHRALEAAVELAHDGIEADVIDLRWLAPLDTSMVVESVRRTGRLVVVQEGCAPGGWASFVTAVVAEQAIDALDAPIRQLTSPNIPVPFAPHLEKQMVPSASAIASAARTLLGRPL